MMPPLLGTLYGGLGPARGTHAVRTRARQPPPQSRIPPAAAARDTASGHSLHLTRPGPLVDQWMDRVSVCMVCA